MSYRTTSLLIALYSLMAGLAGCAAKDDPKSSTPNVGDGVFESDAPGTGSDGRAGNATLDAATPSANGATETGSKSASDAARAIEEADIIKIEGTRLYALSQYGGLSVIDLSVRDQMRLLGRKKVQAQPFEMYVRDHVVFALYNGYGQYIKGSTEGEWSWVTTSYVMAFDTTDPTKPTTIGNFAVPGTIQDSRIVGNALYVVGFESNSCWQCADGQHTTVVSLDISTPSAIRKVDQRAYADDTTTSYSWKRSITVTDQRMYIAGPEYGSNAPVGSTIQVVDISDPSGRLVDGVQVSAAGKIDSRWQMDESNGVLRVVSQPGDWRPSDPPRIQTFAVASAQSISKLATVDMVVPANESLRSVRFDGPRGYAITAVQTDPLFTIDLSNPAAPRQVGELAMPGWIYYMEPRGDRVVALGFDQNNSAGALTVSLFDVSNLAQPTMLDRVNFGGNWSWPVEDQDRIHKAFQVLDANNLVLMPYSGYSYNSGDCYSRYQSGIQLIDWVGDSLELKGIAPAVGQARRGFLYDSRLFAVSDERVESFDIADRSQPRITDSLRLTQIVNQTLDAGTAVVKIGQDWNTNSVSLDTTSLALVEDPASNGHIDVPIGQESCNSWSNLGPVVAKNGKVYLLINQYNYASDRGEYQFLTRLVTVDVTDPTQPKVVGEATLDFGQGWQYWYNGALVDAGASAVMVGNAIAAMGRKDLTETTSEGYTKWVGTKNTVYVIDPTDPTNPSTKSVELPDSLGTTGLLASGTSIALGRYQTSSIHPDREQFFVERLDLSDPSNPVLDGSVNVPGSPVAFDAAASNVVTVDYREIVTEAVTAEYCSATFKNAWFEYKNGDYSTGAIGTCHAMQETIYLVALGTAQARVLGSKPLDVGQMVTNFAVGQDRVFLSTGGYGYYGNGRGGVMIADCMGSCGYYGYYGVQTTDMPLFVVAGLNSGSFGMGQMTLSGGDYWSYSPMVASGQRVLLATGWQGTLAVVDGANTAAPVLVRQTEVLGNAQSLTAIQGVGVASLGYDGVQTIRIAN